MTSSFDRACILVLLAAVVGTGISHVEAQVPSKTRLVPKGAREALAIFEERVRLGQRSAPDQVRSPEEYPRNRVDSVVNGLETLALSARSENLATSAAAALGLAGAAKRGIPGVFDRMVRVYRSSSSDAVRAMIIHYMYDQSDRRVAIGFLKSIASQDPAHQDFDGGQFIAAMVLSEMGTDGRTALVELHDQHLLRDHRTDGFVDWYLRNR